MRELVFEALENASDNEYEDFLMSDPMRVAIDLLDYCADLEGKQIEDVLPFVREWQAKKREEQNG
jgi:hypothetical protein